MYRSVSPENGAISWDRPRSEERDADSSARTDVVPTATIRAARSRVRLMAAAVSGGTSASGETITPSVNTKIDGLCERLGNMESSCEKKMDRVHERIDTVLK